jgi:glycosyltransferase involved in cell wall biosynthesis
VPPKDPQALAEKVEFLLKNEELLVKMKQNSLRRVNRIFTWSNVCRQLSDVYAAFGHNPLAYKVHFSVVR